MGTMQTARLCAIALGLLALASLGAANADDSGAQRPPDVSRHIVFETLGTNGYAIDGIKLRCPSGTHHAHFDLEDESGAGPTLGIVAMDFDGGMGQSIMRRAPQGGIAPAAQFNRGPGWYIFYIFKTGGSTGSSANYNSIQVCHNSSHQTLTDLSHWIFQDQ